MYPKKQQNKEVLNRWRTTKISRQPKKEGYDSSLNTQYIMFLQLSTYFSVSVATTGWSVMYPHLQKDTLMSHASLSIAPACLYTVSNLFGPIAHDLSGLYGHKKLYLIGVMMSSLGLILCSLNRSLLVLYLSYGILCGIGQAIRFPYVCHTYEKYESISKRLVHIILELTTFLTFSVVPVVLEKICESFSLESSFQGWSILVLSSVLNPIIFRLISNFVNPNLKFYSNRPQSVTRLCLDSMSSWNTTQHHQILQPQPPIYTLQEITDHMQMLKYRHDKGSSASTSSTQHDIFQDASSSINPELAIPNSYKGYKSHGYLSYSFNSSEDSLNTYESLNSSLERDDDNMDDASSCFSATSVDTEYFSDQGDLGSSNSDLSIISTRQWKNPLIDSYNHTETSNVRPKSMNIDRNVEILPEIPEEAEEDIDGLGSLLYVPLHTEPRSRPLSLLSIRSNDSFLSLKSSVGSHEKMHSCNDLRNFPTEINKYQSSSNDLTYTVTSSEFNNSETNLLDRNCQDHIGTATGTRQFTKNKSNIPLKSKTYKKLLSRSLCYSIMIAYILSQQIFLLYYTYLPYAGTKFGQGLKSPLLLSSMIISHLLSVVTSHIATSIGPIHRRYYLIAGGILNVFSITSTSVAWNFGSLLMSIIMFGFANGIEMAVLYPAIKDLIEDSQLKLIINNLPVTNAIGGSILIPLFGFIMDKTNSYKLFYRILAGLSTISPLLWILITTFNKPKMIEK